MKIIKVKDLVNSYKASLEDETTTNNAILLGEYLIENDIAELTENQVDQFNFSVSYEEIEVESLEEITAYIIDEA